MKPTSPMPRSETVELLAFGAHPDDIEFGCGAVLAAETARGGTVHMVVASRGESGTNGTPAERTREAENAAAALGATIDFIDLGGDAHFEYRNAHAIELAGIIRRLRPHAVLAPTVAENQHPDHAVLGRLVRDAARLARYGGLAELKGTPPHAVTQVLFYAVGAEGEPRDMMPFFVDVSEERVVSAWVSSMEAHASQMRTRNYLDLQLTRARYHGLRCGVQYAIPLWASDPLLVGRVTDLPKAARRF
jgi:N-acetylglucosamine malate deacetylase 1